MSSRVPASPVLPPRANLEPSPLRSAAADAAPPAERQEVELATLRERYGWQQGSWQDRLLQAADGAKSSNGNGKVSGAELTAYLDSPDDLQFLSSGAIQRTWADLTYEPDSAGMAVDAFEHTWQQDLARQADLGGNADGFVRGREFIALFNGIKEQGKDGAQLWFSDQQAATLNSRVAAFTGEEDHLTPGGEIVGAKDLLKEYYRTVVDDARRVPRFVSYVLTAQDLEEKPWGLPRESNFKQDWDVGQDSAHSKDYSNSGYNRGHMKPAMDSVDKDSMKESFLMSNIAPQTGELNQRSWNTMEIAISELVKATGGRATLLTGSVFLDEKGAPLPLEETRWIGRNGEPRVAVPTHSFKTVLLQHPDGALTMFAYLVPNRHDLPTDKDGITELLAASRVPVDRIEELLGLDLYKDLPADVQARLESDPAAKLAFERGSDYEAASLLWPKDEPAPRLAQLAQPS